MLVAINSVFQVIAFAVLGWFYLSVLPGWLGLRQTTIDVSPVADRAIGADLPRHPAAGRLPDPPLRRDGQGPRLVRDQVPPARSARSRCTGCCSRSSILFALQGDAITSQPWDVVRIALPLLVYFALMWGGGYALGAASGLGYERTTTLAFTAAGNNFELAIAVAIATFGVTSGQALAGVVGPLIEVPVLVGAGLRRRSALRAPLSPTSSHREGSPS